MGPMLYESYRPCVSCHATWSYKAPASRYLLYTIVNTLSAEHNDRHFGDGILKFIFIKIYILIQISLKFVLKGPIDNKLTLVHKMAFAELATIPPPSILLVGVSDCDFEMLIFEYILWLVASVLCLKKLWDVVSTILLTISSY